MLSRRGHDLTMAEAARGPGNARVDHLLVSDMIEPRSRVLDVGCGDGELLKLLESRVVEGVIGVIRKVGVGVALDHGEALGDALVDAFARQLDATSVDATALQ